MFRMLMQRKVRKLQVSIVDPIFLMSQPREIDTLIISTVVPNRVRRLKDGRQVVLTEHVEEFLEWASKLYEISVCSLG